MREPSRHVKKISGARCEGMLSALAPLNEGFAFQYVRDGFLWTVVMDAGLRARFNEKRPAPQRRMNAKLRRDRR